MEKISLIIPTFNSENTIVRCIDSILSQTYKNIETIVVDDGSTDKTSDIIRKKYGKNIRLIRQPNLGVSSARNIGIEKSTGDYIMFADADDTFNSRAVEIMLECAKKHDASIVKINTTEIYLDRATIPDFGDISNDIVDMNNAKNVNKLVEKFFGLKADIKCLVMTLLIKKDVLEERHILFDKKLYLMEDVVFYSDLFLTREKIFFLDMPLYNYYQNAESVSHTTKNLDRNIRGVILCNMEINKRFPDNKSINSRHFKIIFNLIAKQYLYDKKLIIPEELSNIARKSSFSENAMFWRLARRTSCDNKKGILKFMIIVKAIQIKATCRKERLL